jgi:hypothetical protein
MRYINGTLRGTLQSSIIGAQFLSWPYFFFSSSLFFPYWTANQHITQSQSRRIPRNAIPMAFHHPVDNQSVLVSTFGSSVVEVEVQNRDSGKQMMLQAVMYYDCPETKSEPFSLGLFGLT